MCLNGLLYFPYKRLPARISDSLKGVKTRGSSLPLLVLLCTEVLSGLCRKAQERGTFIAVKVAKGSPYVNHLLFADDTMFFCKTNPASCKTLASILLPYERILGQCINLDKSFIIFSAKTPTVMRIMAKRILKIRKEGGAGKYLGIPENFG